MADNNTFVLFEEIKNKLETIYRELKELKEKENGSVSLPIQSTPAQSDEQKEQELLNQYEQRTKAVLNKYINVQVRIKDEEAKSMDKLVASVLTMLHEWQEQKEQPQPQERDLCKTLPHSLSFLFLNTIGSPAVNIFGF